MAQHSSRESLHGRLVIGCLAPLLVAVIFQASYAVTSERRAMLGGLEEKARSLASLMVDVVGPSLELEDVTGVKDGLAYIAHDADLAFAAVVTPEGDVAAFLGADVLRTQLKKLLQPTAQSQILRADGVLIAYSPLKPHTTKLGTVVVGLNTAGVDAEVTHRVFVVSAIAAAGTAAAVTVVLWLASTIIRRNRDLKILMDSAGQGFLRVTRQGYLLPEHAAILEEWFGPWPAQGTLWQYLSHTAPKTAEWMELLWQNVTADILPVDVSLEQLPTQFEATGKTFQVVYKYLLGTSGRGAGRQGNIMVIVSDITAQVEQERTKADQREIIVLFQRLVKDRQGVLDFFEDTGRTVQRLAEARHPSSSSLKQELHTLKGNCAVFGLTHMAGVCHDLEHRLELDTAVLLKDDLLLLQRAWYSAQDKLKEFTRDAQTPRIDVEVVEYEAMLAAILRGEPTHELAARLRRWTQQPARQLLERYAQHARSVARRLGKGDITTRVEAEGVRIPPGALARFWGTLTHVVNNAVDHGIEAPEVRAAHGKSHTGCLLLRAMERSEQFVVEIEDDGQGIDWTKLTQRARALGRENVTREQLVETIFSEGLTTKDNVTDVSGRGVGMGAVHAACLATGGSVHIMSEPGSGTRFVFCWPASVLQYTTAVAKDPQRGTA